MKLNNLIQELKTDKEYYYAWQSNIAMSFIDGMRRSKKRRPSYKDLHKIANEAAKEFLNILIKEDNNETKYF